MDRQALQGELEARMREVAQRISGCASGSLSDMAAMERLIYEEADRLKATVLQAWVDQAREGPGRACCPGCGQRMRQKERSDRTLACLGGQVKVERVRWWCEACKASFFPSGRGDDGGRDRPDARSRPGRGGGGGGPSV